MVVLISGSVEQARAFARVQGCASPKRTLKKPSLRPLGGGGEGGRAGEVTCGVRQEKTCPAPMEEASLWGYLEGQIHPQKMFETYNKILHWWCRAESPVKSTQEMS